MRPVQPPNNPAPQSDDEGLAEFLAGQDPVDVAAANWLVRRQDGLTEEEQAEYESWLAEDEEHPKAIAELEEVWGGMDDLPDEDVQALKARLPQRETPTPTPPQPQFPAPNSRIGGREPPSGNFRPRASWVGNLVLLIPRLAVAMFMVSVLGAGWFGWQTWEARPTFVQVYQTERGQQKKIELPDGSQLWLDVLSRAEVALYRKRREVVLPHGQAQFTVRASDEQPFDVLAGPLRITVVGTQFTVRNGVETATDGSTTGSISVAVEQGTVRVAHREVQDDGQAQTTPLRMDLRAGQSLTTDAQGEMTAISTYAGDPAPWREGRVVFDGITLAQALAELERYGNTNLVINDPKVAALRIHGSYSLRGLQAFADALPQVLPVRVVRGAGGKAEIVMRR